MKMQMAEIAKALNTTCEGDNQTVITSVAFDSRKITDGGLFVPLEGERDGHEFIASAINNGASATLWKKGHPNKPEDIAVIEVDDPLAAMQELARYYLRKVNPTVVGITGSNGKTTTKDMIAAVLSKRFNVHKTQANFNNEIGVPMTILEMKPNTEILVLEMGMTRLQMLRWKLLTFCVKMANLSSMGMNHYCKNVLRNWIKLKQLLVLEMKIQFMQLALRVICIMLPLQLMIQSKNSQSQ